MVLINLSTPQIIFIIVASVVVLVGIFLAIYIPVKKKRKNKFFREYYYKKVYSIAFDQDYYLINKFTFKTDTNKMSVIDHILFGNKYIYLISDLYYEGNLSGSYDDKSLVFVNNNGKKSYTDNPFTRSEMLLTCLSISANQQPGNLIGIVLVNDECKLDINSNSKQYFIVQRKKLPALIKELESREVGTLNAQNLERAVKNINSMNKKKKVNDSKRA